jgi:parallel beta-helix repeat protein
MGVSLYGCSKNSISGNNITANGGGINLEDSSNNTIYHNNFIGNAFQVSSDGSSNTWDNGYPSGGNYWSDYNGTDLYSGQHQNVTGSDGVGDTPYVIDANNTDDYPLMGVFSDFNVAEGVDVQVVSNSTISDFQFNGTALLFDVSGVNGTTGFCNVRVPTVLLNGTLTVLVNAIQVQYNLLPSLNDNQSYLYFTYGHSTEQVTITPEFPSSLIMAMFMLATLLTITIHKKTK